MKKQSILYALLVYASFLTAEAAEVCLWKTSLADKSVPVTYGWNRIPDPKRENITSEGLRINGRGGIAFLEIPKNIVEQITVQPISFTVEVKTDGVSEVLPFATYVKTKTGGSNVTAFEIPLNTEGWKKYHFRSTHESIKGISDAVSFFLRIPIPAKGSVILRNFQAKKLRHDVNLTPYYNTGYIVGKTPETANNFTGNPHLSFRSILRRPRFARVAGIPFQPWSTEKEKNPQKEVIRFSTQSKFPGIQELTIPLGKENFSAEKLYLFHILDNCDSDFSGTVTLKGKDGEKSYSLKFGQDVRNMDDMENKPNAVNGVMAAGNFNKAVFFSIVSQFDIPDTVGALQEIRIQVNPGSKGLYFLSGIHLSNWAYELDRSPVDVVKRTEEWVPFPFPSKSGVLPGSILDLTPKEVVPVGKYGRLISGPNGEVVAEKQPDQPLRFRMTGTGGGGYMTNLSDPDHAANMKYGPRRGQKMMTDFVFTPYSEDMKKNIEAFAKSLAMQRYTMLRLTGADVFIRYKGLDFTEKDMDNFFYMVKCLRENGIYLHWDIGTAFYWGREWTSENAKQRNAAFINMFFDEAERKNAQRGFTKLLATINPYTGLALKDDPILVFINGWNESHIPFKNVTHPVAQKMLAEFLRNKYKNIAELKKAWGTLAKSSWNDFADIPVNFEWNEYQTKPSIRKADMMEFYIQRHHEMLDWYKKVLREIGFKGMISNYNFGQSLETMRSRKRVDYVGMNQYHDHPLPTTISRKSPIEVKNTMLRSIATTQYLDRPLVITEAEVCFWNQYRYEQPFVLDAYAALNGFDVVTNFAGIVPNRGYGLQWKEVPAIKTFFGTYDPLKYASEFLGAWFFNRGLIKTSETQVCIRLDEKEIAKANDFNYALGSNQSMFALFCRMGIDWTDSTRKGGTKEITLPRVSKNGVFTQKLFSNMVDMNDTKFDVDACVASMKKQGLLPAENRTNVKKGIFESSTGQLYMDSNKKLGVVNTPQAQGVFALAGTEYTLPNLEIRKMTKNGMLNIVAVDEKDLGDSQRIAVVYATDAMNQGMVFQNNSRRHLLLNGAGPVLYQTGKFTIVIKNRNAANLKAWVVRLDGSRDGELPVSAEGDKLTFTVDTAKIKGGPAIFFELAEK